MCVLLSKHLFLFESSLPLLLGSMLLSSLDQDLFLSPASLSLQFSSLTLPGLSASQHLSLVRSGRQGSPWTQCLNVSFRGTGREEDEA